MMKKKPAQTRKAAREPRPIRLSRPWGAHMSIAGGVANSIGRAGAVGAKSIQIFTKNNNQWKGKPLEREDMARFGENSKELGVQVFASHDCYLINLASHDREILKKSREAFLDEIDRADALDIPCLVFHPGAHTGAGEAEGIKRIIESLNWALQKRPDCRTTLTLETTAGQGSSIGHRFEQLARIMEAVEKPDRLGVCLDTCHVFAAGYEINAETGYRKTFKEFDSIIGLDRLMMFHLNDSKRELGSRVDRHEHIGKGHIGLAGFRLLVNDRRFFKTPMILETPKGPEGLEDIANLRTLARLIKKR